MRDSDSVGPTLLIALVVAIVIIALGYVLPTNRGPINPVLVRQFEAQPVDPNAPTPAPWQLPKLNLPELPPELSSRVSELYNQYVGGGSVPALTPVARSNQVRIEIESIRREQDQVRVIGKVSNQGNQPVDLSPGDFTFRDSQGTLYRIKGSGSVTLGVGQGTALDLSAPIPPDRGVSLILTLAPDPPIEMILLAQPGR